MTDDATPEVDNELRNLKMQLKHLIEERSRRTLDQCKLDAMVKELPEVRKALEGANWLLNLAVANSRAVVKENLELKDRIARLETTVAELMAAIGQQQMKIETNTERLDKASEWLKTKGMK